MARLTCLVLFMLVMLNGAGCGRYKSPLPPESLAPRAVTDLEVVAQHNGVRLAWRAPEDDRRGKELTSMEGYQVQRKEIVNRGDETAPTVTFDDIAFVPDSHIKVRDRMRAEARAEGKIGRTVKAPEELSVFSYLDATPRTGSTYLYQIVPQNQGRTDGVVREVAKVVFRGVQSDVDILSADDAGSTTEVLPQLGVGPQDTIAVDTTVAADAQIDPQVEPQ